MKALRHRGSIGARRRVLSLLGGGVLAPLLGACTEPEPPLNVGTIVFPGYEFLFLAREKGWLPPTSVRLVELLSSTDNLRALADGQTDAVTLTLDEVMGARAAGVNLRVLALLDISVGADAMMTRPDITALAQLRGRRIGVEDSAMGVVMFGAVLSAAGLRVEDVLKVPYTADQSVVAYQSGQVDAAITFEPWASQLEEIGARRLFDSRAIPNRIVDVLAARAEVITARPRAVAALVAAHFKALDYWTSHPAEANALLAPRLQVEPAEVPAAFKGLVLPDVRRNRDYLRPEGEIAQVTRDIQRMLLQQRVLREAVPFDGLVDMRFLPA